MQPDDDLVRFAPDEPAALAVESPLSWKLLVVDDDEEVHEATRFALHDALIADRPLRLIHAYTAHEAAAAIAAEPDIAAILLDVVMESADAGLKLVRRIREELRLADVRIILRTGQPGYAPELQVIRDYDINDYKTKAELTHTRLMTTLIAAIRSYEQIHAISENRRGLELIVNAAAGLMELPAMSAFAEGALLQIAALLKLPAEGIVCAQKGLPFDDAGDAEAVARFKEAAEAYEVLSDADKRARYDRFGHAATDQFGQQFQDVNDIFEAFGDIFSEMFGGGSARRGGRRVRRGADIRCDVSLTLEDKLRIARILDGFGIHFIEGGYP